MALAGNIWRTWAWLAISLAALPSLRLAAEPQANWRTYTAVDGLRETRTTSVAVSPQGNIWVTHGDASMLSRLDGYNISTIPAPIGNLRIYESREGQLWSLYTDGLQEFKGGRWITYSINDIRAEFQSDLLRRVRLIPLQPIGRDRVLFLLAENLMEWNAALGRTRLVLEVSHTRLERFLDMTEASDGGAWITGRRGVVRISSSLSSTNGALAWKEHLFSDELRVENGLRPIEDESGGITLVADSLLTRKRVPVYFDGREAWQAIITMEDSIRKSWRGLDNSFWGLTINALLRLDVGPQSYVERQELGAGRFYDIAAETNGVFWVATVEGLTRHAPSLWHTPLEAQNINVMVHSLNQDAAGRLWCISANAMGMSQQQQWRLFGFEDESEQFTEPAGAPFFLPSGLVALNINNQFRLFSPKTEEFQTPTHPSNRELELVGQLKDGALVLKSVDARQPQVGYRLDTFDGRRFQHLMEASNTAALGSEVFFASTVGEETWVGGSAGLAVFRNRQWLNLMPEAAGVPDGAFCILALSNNVIWFGCRDRVVEYDGRGWRSVRGNLDRVNSMMQSRDGTIWVATANGLYRHRRGVWLANGLEEGLPSMAIYRVFEDKQGQIWAGTARGLSLFRPDADRDPPLPRIENPDSLRQVTSDDPITIEFSGSDKWKYTAADRLLFSWRMDEGKWTTFHSINSATFRRLGAGMHQFDVRALDRNFNESEQISMVSISVITPWYEDSRTRVIALLGLVMVLFFAGVAINRHRHLVQSYAAVEKMVTRRTQELQLANQQLLHSQKMTALGTLAAGIAHDFNNILSIIKGSAQIIEGNLDDKEKIKTRVDRISTVVDQGAGIIRAMLGYSRQGDNQVGPFDVNPVIEETITLLGDRFLREVPVRFEPAAPLPPVHGARELVQQMVLNLILNAADAIGKHGEISLRTGETKQLPERLVLRPATATDYVFIRVEDNGIGIAPEHLERIFEPFFTTKSFSSRRGTGLGLSMVYEFAREQNFGLAVQSELKKGSAFLIFIPVQPSIAASD